MITETLPPTTTPTLSRFRSVTSRVVRGAGRLVGRIAWSAGTGRPPMEATDAQIQAGLTVAGYVVAALVMPVVLLGLSTAVGR